MLTLLLGTDWTQNRQEILRRIARDVEEKQSNRILMVPELISHDTERLLSAVAGDTASRYAQVLSFTRLGRRVADLAGGAAMECLDNSGRIVAMAAAARQLHSQLKTYAAVETKPEFLAQVVDAVDEMKRCCITSRDLHLAAGQCSGILAQKLEELALLMESYDGICANGKRDPRDQMTWVLEQLPDLDFVQRHVFYVDGFPDFTRQNLGILEQIIRSGTDITVSLNTDSLHSGDMAFEKAAQTAKQLWQIARNSGIAVHIDTVPARQDALEMMRRGLFQGKISAQPSLGGRVRAVQAASVYQECQVAAEEVFRQVEQGARYRDIAIVCPQMETYAPVLKLIFGKCRIPLYLAGTEEVLFSGVISTVIFALEAALGGLEQRDVVRYLRSTLSPISRDGCDRMENYAYIWGISGSAWKETWTGHPQGLSGQWDDRARQELARLNEDRAVVIGSLWALKEAFREAGNVGQQVQAVYAFLEQIQFAPRLETLAGEMDARQDNRTAQIYHQLWEILIDALEQLYDVLGHIQWDSDTFVRLLKLLLSQCDVGTIPPVLDAVSVGPVSTMRCQQQKILIFLGANEGALPRYGGSSGLLTDQERMALRSLGVPLTGGAMEGLQEEFAEIYGVFCGAEQQVTATCSGGQPSFVFQRLATMSGGEETASPLGVTQLGQPLAAGSYLATHGQQALARELGVEAEYQLAQDRRSYALGQITRENIQRLYGKTLRLSASQVDRQAECRLSYFLKYGLRLQERKEATVDPAEFGTYVHAVLEQTCRQVVDRGGFHAVTLEETLALANTASDRYLQEHFSQLDSQRMAYLFRRNVRELEMVVRELWRELSQSAYVPSHFELKFDENGEMPGVSIPNDSMDAQLRGVVDRVDLWRRGESTYFRVVDYKTGKKSFDYCDVLNGVGLQMLIYLFALEKEGEGVIPGKRISAGVQYFPARAPYLTVEGSMTREQAQAERKAAWKRSGLLLQDEASLRAMDVSENMDSLCCSVRKDGTISGDIADRRQMGQLSDYMMALLGDMVQDIASGNVTPNPYTRGSSHNACTFCPYGAVCHRETVADRRNFKAVKAADFWEQIDKEVENRG